MPQLCSFTFHELGIYLNKALANMTRDILTACVIMGIGVNCNR